MLASQPFCLGGLAVLGKMLLKIEGLMQYVKFLIEFFKFT